MPVRFNNPLHNENCLDLLLRCTSARCYTICWRLHMLCFVTFPDTRGERLSGSSLTSTISVTSSMWFVAIQPKTHTSCGWLATSQSNRFPVKSPRSVSSFWLCEKGYAINFKHASIAWTVFEVWRTVSFENVSRHSTLAHRARRLTKTSLSYARTTILNLKLYTRPLHNRKENKKHVAGGKCI